MGGGADRGAAASEQGTTARPRIEAGPPFELGAELRVQVVDSPASWAAWVSDVLDGVAAGQVGKVVLARRVVVEADRPFAVEGVFDHLRQRHPGSFVFAVGGFVGASPELLVRRRGRRVTSLPTAGTVARGATPEEDDRLAQALAESAKDGAEHAYVVEAVDAVLSPLCGHLTVSAQPAVVRLATVSHLVTSIDGVLDEPAPSALALAGLLHPTPAVAGTPREAAVERIARLESADRGRYAGPVGWVDAAGDGEWAVALRCGEIEGEKAVLWAGAGIVAGSEPEAEWAETQAKLQAMLTALVRP